MINQFFQKNVVMWMHSLGINFFKIIFRGGIEAEREERKLYKKEQE